MRILKVLGAVAGILLFALLGLWFYTKSIETRIRITGTRSAEFSGWFRNTKVTRHISGVRVPYPFGFAGDGLRLEECEFLKQRATDVLIMEMQLPGEGALRVEAPAGTSGVKFRRDGAKLITETIP